MKKLIFLLLYCLFSCSTNTKISENRWEGITGNNARIIISEYFPTEDVIDNNKTKSLLMEKINSRFSLIIASYITLNLNRNKISYENDVILNSAIQKSSSTIKIITYDLSDNNIIETIADYDIKQINETIININR